jgi:hypothetical protein
MTKTRTVLASLVVFVGMHMMSAPTITNECVPEPHMLYNSCAVLDASVVVDLRVNLD